MKDKEKIKVFFCPLWYQLCDAGHGRSWSRVPWFIFLPAGTAGLVETLPGLHGVSAHAALAWILCQETSTSNKIAPIVHTGRQKRQWDKIDGVEQ